MLGVLSVGVFENTWFDQVLGMHNFQRPGLASRALKRCIWKRLELPLKNVKVKTVSALVVVLAGRPNNKHILDTVHVFWSMCELKY